MNNPSRNLSIAGCLILLIIVFISACGFHLNKQVLPPLNEMVPVKRNINAVKEIFVPARGSWNWIDLRLTNTPIQFGINRLNLLDSSSDMYQRLRRSLPVGSEITLWAIPKGPTLSEAFFFTSINRKPLHELISNETGNETTGLGAFQEMKQVNYDVQLPVYDVVQIVINGQILLNYSEYAEKKQKTEKYLLWALIFIGVLILLIGLYLISGNFNRNHEKTVTD